MDNEERPNKIRKLSHGGQQEDVAAQIDSVVGSASLELDRPAHGDSLEALVDVQTTLDQHEPHKTIQNVPSDDDESQATSSNAGSLPPPAENTPFVDVIAQQDDPPLSKSQQKKLRKKAEWESKREERKVVRKEKQVAKRERKRAEKRQEAENDADKTKEKPATQKAVQLPITILIDCDFDNLMRDGERISLAAQITRCYSDNKNSLFRAHLTLCSFGGKLRERFDNILTHYKSWRGVRTLDCDFVEAAEKAKEWMLAEGGGQLAGVFSKYAELDDAAQFELKNAGELVYLTSDGDEDLTELKPYSTYIIGGLVDKNREKGICYKRARKHGVRTARLPIGEYMDMQSRKILTTNHVNEIMMKWLECGDWGEAFMQAIPKRKGGKLKTLVDDSVQSEE